MKFFICLLLVTITTAAPWSCNCGIGPGENMCAKKDCAPLVVRPVELPKPIPLTAPQVVPAPLPALTPLAPMKGPCTCHTTLVKPAIVPKPKCSCKRVICATKKQEAYNEEQQNEFLFGKYGDGGASVVAAPEILLPQSSAPVFLDKGLLEAPDKVPAPADSVSLQLAYKLAQEACTQEEDRLSYGFRTLPKEVPQPVRKVNNVPEEKLYRLNGQIVELKKIPCTDIKTVDEEATEDLLAVDEESDEIAASGTPKVLTLGEIGYAPAKIKSAAFIDIPVSVPSCESAPLQPSHGAGFVPGGVVTAELPKSNCYQYPKPQFIPCEDDLTPPEPGYQLFAASSSSKSSSSSSNSNIFQKFSCDDC